MAKMIRIKDVAEAVGVSTATVSNVINGKDQRVSDVVREKVLNALDEIGYIRNRSAIMLARTSSNMIGVVLPDKGGNQITLEDPYFSALVGNLEHEIRARNCYMYLIAQQTVDEIVRQAMAWNLEGLIVCNMMKKELKNLCEKYHRGIVSIDSYVNRESKFINISTDDFGGGYEMGKYLIQKGHKKIAMLADNDKGVDHYRWRGLQQAMKEAELPVSEGDHFVFSSSELVRNLEWERMLSKWKGYTALFVASDFHALEVSAFLQSKGLRIPEDLSISGFDDLIYAKLARPRLTTMSQNIGHKAKLAVEALISMDQEGEATEVTENDRWIIPVKLVERDSVSKCVQND